MMAGTIHRLDAADPAVIAEQQLAEWQPFRRLAGQSETSLQILPRPLRLTALDPQAKYTITLRNRASAPRQSRSAPNALKTQSLTLTGAALMQNGITLPITWPASIWVLEGQRVFDAERCHHVPRLDRR